MRLLSVVGPKAMAEKKIGKQRLVTGEEFGLVCRDEPHVEKPGNLYAVADVWDAGVPFHGHERRLQVDIREFNKMDPDWRAGRNIIAAGECKVFVDDFQVYYFKFQHAEDGLIQAWSVIDRLKQFSLSLFGRELFAGEEVSSLFNRKVYLSNIPAEVQDFAGNGTVELRCATEQGLFPFTAKGLGYHVRDDGTSRKWVDILSSEINWFRKD